jgi:hypothetical protein
MFIEAGIGTVAVLFINVVFKKLKNNAGNKSDGEGDTNSDRQHL